MSKGHMNIKRIIHRINEEILSTIKIAKITSIRKALITLIAKVDIQKMNHNGYYESKKTKHHLLKKHDVMIEYYEKTFSDFIKNYNNTNNTNNTKDNFDKSDNFSKCIWVCWWQGLDNAPEIVKKCINSIIKNSNGHKVIVLTDENYKEYANIPNWIEEKRNNGIITRTNFSDLLRLTLLAQHGGMWLDATFYCTSPIPEEYFQLPIWSIKRPEYGHASVASGYFAGYSLACNYENRWIFATIRDFFLNYWMHNDYMVDYLMVDYMIVLAQRFDKKIKTTFDQIPNNNKNCDELFKILDKRFDLTTWNKIKEDTILFKLTWKNKYKLTKNGEDTFYGKIIKSKI